jgi:hypothetical protein
VSNLAVYFDNHRIVRELVRQLRVIAVVLIAALALYQIGDHLVSCLKRLSPDPIACSPPDVTLPHTDNERPEPGQALSKSPFASVLSATTAAMPCFSQGSRLGPR